MRNPVLMVTTFMLFAASAAAVVSLAFNTPASTPMIRGQHRSSAVIDRYYDAINTMIATGDETPVQVVVSPRLEDLDSSPPGWSGQEGLIRYLSYLHHSNRSLRINATDVVIDGDSAMVRIAVSIDEHDLPSNRDSKLAKHLWPTFELLHFDDHQIISRAFDWDRIVIFESMAEELQAPGGFIAREPLSVKQVTIAQHSTMSIVTGLHPQIVFITQGHFLAMSRSQGLTTLVWTNSGEHARVPETLSNGATRLIPEGALVYLPPLAHINLVNHAEEPGTFILASHDGGTNVDSVDLDAVVQMAEPGIRSQTVANYHLADREVEIIWTFGRITMMPGGIMQLDGSAIGVFFWNAEQFKSSGCTTSIGTADTMLCAVGGDCAEQADVKSCVPGSEMAVVSNTGSSPLEGWTLIFRSI